MSMRTSALTFALLLISSTAAGDSLADTPRAAPNEAAAALEAGDAKRAIALLTPTPLEGADTCVLAKALLLEKQEERAMLYFERCNRFASDSDLRRQLATLKKELRKQRLAPVSLALTPTSASATVNKTYDASDILLHDEDIWLAKGKYQVDLRAPEHESASFSLVVDSHDRMLMPLSLEKKKAVTTKEIDLGADAGSELGSVATAADPRPKKFKPILPKRYRKAPDPTLVPDDSHERGSALPWIAAAGGLIGVGSGLAFHLNEETTPALIGYGVGAGLLGLAGYLFLRGDESESSQTDRISILVSPNSLVYGHTTYW